MVNKIRYQWRGDWSPVQAATGFDLSLRWGKNMKGTQ